MWRIASMAFHPITRSAHVSHHQKRVLVTGANKGIGLAIVAATLEADDKVVIFLGARDPVRGEAAREDLLAGHPEWARRLYTLTLDVTDDTSVENTAAEIASRYPDDPHPLYAVVNNAGIGSEAGDMRTVLNVNVHGMHRVCEAFIPLLDQRSGRVVNVASASGPMFLARCRADIQTALTRADITWTEIESIMNRCLALEAQGGDFEAQGFADGSSYGLSKACVNAYTINLARSYPAMRINSCTPGYIETDMTRPFATASGSSPDEMGMKPAAEGAKAPLHLLLGDVSTGWYYGSDAVRSPLDRYRGPGEPAYDAK
jgi:NAD(P)-dependent dehydrogenase (short-subunit alcohol dehydrogenase family)